MNAPILMPPVDSWAQSQTVEERFPTEAALCDDFSAAARDAGWTVYPECGGWDLLLVAPNGFQLGVEAKLRGNMKVLAQYAERLRDWRSETPDAAVVLVRDASRDFENVSHAMGARVFKPDAMPGMSGGKRFIRPYAHCWPGFTLADNGRRDWSYISLNPGHQPDPKRRELQVQLPTVVPDPSEAGGGRAGVSALTPWREATLRICWEVETHGVITPRQLRQWGHSSTMWVRRGWLTRDAGGSYRRATGEERAAIAAEGWQLDAWPADGWRKTTAKLAKAGRWK